MDDNEIKLLALGIVAGLILGVVAGNFLLPKKKVAEEDFLPSSVVSEKTINFLNSRYLQPQGLEGRVNSLSEYGNLYEIQVDILKDGQLMDTQPVWVTKDGEIIIFDLLNMSQEEKLLQEHTQQNEPRRVNVTADDDPFLGPEDAPVVIIEFSDFQCPFCKRFRDQTLDRILEEYGDKVKFVYRDFPLEQIHPLALNASLAANCAGEQGKYFEFHDLLFENVQDWSTNGDFSKYAEELGLDMEQFNSCLASGKYVEEVKKDLQDGINAGVTGTPAFFINGIPVSGAQPFEVFKSIIDSELNQ